MPKYNVNGLQQWRQVSCNQSVDESALGQWMKPQQRNNGQIHKVDDESSLENVEDESSHKTNKISEPATILNEEDESSKQ